MGPRVHGAAGPSISVVGRGTRNIAETNTTVLGLGSAPALASAYPTHAYRLYRWSLPVLAHMTALEELWPAVGRDKKVGFRFGGKGVMPLGALAPWPFNLYFMPHVKRFPVPTYGFGFTAVPAHESRAPRFPSWSGSSSDRREKLDAEPPDQEGETNGSRQTKGGGSAPPRGGSVPSPSNGRPSPSSRRNGSRRNTLRISPWCRSHRRRHWCPVTRRR